MTNQEKGLLLEQLAEKEEFIIAISNAQNKQELQAVFAANGVEMDDAQTDAFVAYVQSAGSDDLNESELENVAGGSVDPLTVLTWAWEGTKKVAKYAWKWGRKLAQWEKNGYK